jgi:hypothetical protein
MKQNGRRGKGTGRASKSSLPRARQDVLTMDVADEVVVYDKKGHHGHCLNRPAAIVWRHLDGQTSMKALVARLRKELDGPADEDTVWLALKELDKAELLEDGFELPGAHDVSRREALRRFGVAAAGGAVLLPAITSLVAPPVHAQISAVGCPTPDSCVTVSCAGGCSCAPTTEQTNVCVIPTCQFATLCSASSGCPPGQVCTTIGCCPQGSPFCVPIAAAGVICTGGANSTSTVWH